MTHKRYNLVDNAYLQLANSINASIATINVYFPTTYTWNKPLPDDNWIGTLVKYGVDGNPIKMEKVYVTSTSGGTLTVTRGYMGDGAQSFDEDDYLFLNVTAENIDDIHMRIDEESVRTDDNYSQGNHRLRVYREIGDPALQVRIGAGTYRVGPAEGLYAGGTLTVGASLTTYIMLNSAGVIQTSTIGWNGQYARLAIVVSGASTITSITLWKNDVVGGEIGADGFQNITSTTYRGKLLTQFISDGVTYIITYKGSMPTSITNGSDTWTIVYSRGLIQTTIKS